MKRAQHTAHCEKVLGPGRGHPEVHDYLDELNDKLGPKHRDVRHNSKGVAYCFDKWGAEAGAAACLHIWADRVGLIQKDDGTFEIANYLGVKP